MRHTRAFVFAGIVLFLAVVGSWLWNRMPAVAPAASADAPRVSAAEGNLDSRRAMPDLSPAGVLARVFDKLRVGSLAAGELNWLRRQLLAADSGEALAAIAAFLATGRDARTGEIFEIAKGGELAGAPTFRVMLLDLFGRICRNTGTDEAEKFARALVDRKTSADEWAVALRNIAWGAPADRGFLAGKAREMLGYQPWRQQPGAGFLEALDVVVFTRDVTFVTDLAALLGSDEETLQRAAGVALDRFSEMAPLDVMMYLNRHPAEFADRPLLRADYYSKADLSQPAQRREVEAYLDRRDVSAAEKSKLLSVFASPGSFVGDTLVTAPPPADIGSRRVAALQEVLNDWLKANRFPDLLAPLANLRQRLAE